MDWVTLLQSIPYISIGIIVIIGIYFRLIKKVPLEKGKVERIGYFDDLPDSVLPKQPDYEKVIQEKAEK